MFLETLAGMKTLLLLFKNQQRNAIPLYYCGLIHIGFALLFLSILPVLPRLVPGFQSSIFAPETELGVFMVMPVVAFLSMHIDIQRK